jgi:outer membrane protein assembly factor BamB
MRYASLLTLAASICIVSAVASFAADVDGEKLNNWHQWRGPLATGVAPNGNPPTEWSTTKNVKWKVPIAGKGSASPIVWGDRIYILTAVKTDRTAEAPKAANNSRTTNARLTAFEQVDDSNLGTLHSPFPTRLTLAQATPPAEPPPDRPEGDRFEGGRRRRGGFGGPGGRPNIAAPTNFHQFKVLCIDRHSGKTIWERTACEVIPHEGHHDTGSFASASPITDGKFLYASFGSRGIYCYDLDGNLKWDRPLGNFHMRMSFGEGSSPTVYEDTLVQTCDQEEDSFVIALDTRTGEEKWRQPRDEVSTWGTPLVVSAAGRTQAIVTGSNRVRSYDLKNGELIWECGGLGSNPIACPVVFENLVIAMSGHNNPAGVAVALDSKGDVTDKVVWKIEGSTSYVASPLLLDGVVFFPKSRNAILSSVDAKTGKYILSQQRLPDMSSIYSSPVAAAGRVYVSSREGTTLVIKPGEKLDIIATNNLEETIDASPAIVGKEIIIRTENNLYCISE